MKSKKLLLFGLIFFICECNSISFARDYDFKDLGTLGGNSSGAQAINNNGQVVGISLTSANTYYHAFIWNAESGMMDLGTFGSDASKAIDINDSGQVLGQAGGAPFIWSEADGYTKLYPNSHAYVYSINNLGQVAGAIDSKGYIWNSPTELKQYPYVQELFAVNDNGQTIGSYGTNTVNYSTCDSFFFDSNFDPYDIHTFCNIGTLPPKLERNFTDVVDMNNYGVVLGTSHFRPFIWDSVNGMREISIFGEVCYPQAINNLGQVVGYCKVIINENGNYEYHAFIWDEQNGMQDLGAFGGNDAMAYDINDSGQIVGEYRSSSGYPHAFLLTPQTVPEPSLILSYLLGLMWITKSIIRRK